VGSDECDFFEGQEVIYVGLPKTGSPSMGDRGVILDLGHAAPHVQWQSGKCSGQVSVVAFTEIAESELPQRLSVIAVRVKEAWRYGGAEAAVRVLEAADLTPSAESAALEGALSRLSQRDRATVMNYARTRAERRL